jgi:hypothetical protein
VGVVEGGALGCGHFIGHLSWAACRGRGHVGVLAAVLNCAGALLLHLAGLEYTAATQ